MIAKPTKPTELLGRGYSKEEIETRKYNEEKLKGESDKVHIAPKWLCKDAKKEYKRLVKELENTNILTNVDIGVVAIVADAYIKMNQANEILKKEGMLINHTNKAGAENLVKHPALEIYSKYNDIYKKYLVEIGLSPSSRAKLSMINIEKQEENKLKDLLQGLRG